MKRKYVSMCLGVLGVLLIGIGSFLLVKDDTFNTGKLDTSVKDALKTDTTVNNDVLGDEEVIKDEKDVLLEAPAANTLELIKSMNEIEVSFLENDVLEFSLDAKVEKCESVAIWIYSEPQFLGLFEVVLGNDSWKIEGLSSALDKISIDSGDHNLAIATSDGEFIGYVDVYVTLDNLITERKEIVNEEVSDSIEDDTTNSDDTNNLDDEVEQTVVKEVVVKKEIAFKTITQKEVNLLRGTKEVIQTGSNGMKEITYSVTYDSEGNEISREKVSEKIITPVVEQIENIGVSDFNLNTDYIKGTSFGSMCTLDKTYVGEDGNTYCNDIDNALNSFFAVKINDNYYVTCFDSSSCQSGGESNASEPFKVSEVSTYVYSGKYNNTLYYFNFSGGGADDVKLTQELCSKYNLSCGTW